MRRPPADRAREVWLWFWAPYAFGSVPVLFGTCMIVLREELLNSAFGIGGGQNATDLNAYDLKDTMANRFEVDQRAQRAATDQRAALFGARCASGGLVARPPCTW